MKNFDELAKPILDDPDRRRDVERHRADAVAEHLAYSLAEVRKSRDFTQVEISRLLDVSQPEVSRIENSDDLRVSTLADYVEAMGGHLRLAAAFDGQEVPISVRSVMDAISGSPSRDHTQKKPAEA